MGKGNLYPSRKPLIFFCVLVVSALAFAGIYASFNSQRNASKNLGKLYPLKPGILKELLALSPAQLEQCDIARMNLLCGSGLPGSESLNMDDCLATLDQWAAHVKSETDRNFHQFRDNPGNFNNSEGYFRALLLIGVLQQDFNVHYNPARITSPSAPEPDSVFFADSKDLFLHGLTGSQATGTCISLPVLYVAVGHRLGYPMKLVTAKAHLFARWESADGRERFNIEATGQGLSTPGDNDYKKWPFPMTDQEIKANSYLKSLTAAEDLSIFLETRGHCLRVARRLAEAREAYVDAQALTPQWPDHKLFLTSLEPGEFQSRATPSIHPVRPLPDSMAIVESITEHNRRMMETPQPPVSR
jgi:hypothetical protein